LTAAFILSLRSLLYGCRVRPRAGVLIKILLGPGARASALLNAINSSTETLSSEATVSQVTPLLLVFTHKRKNALWIPSMVRDVAVIGLLYHNSGGVSSFAADIASTLKMLLERLDSSLLCLNVTFQKL
jgi:hypothetical protein